MPKGLTKWTLEDLERMKDYSELDVYYEMLDLMVKLEPYAERATMGKKASKQVIARESRNLKFLVEFLRGMTTDYNNSEVPTALNNRIEKERRKRENAEAILAARMQNIERAGQREGERIAKLRAAMEEMKRKNEERKKQEQSKASGEDSETQGQL